MFTGVRMRNTFFAAIAGFWLAADAAGAAPPEVPFAKDFQIMGITITSGGDILTYAAARNVGGKVAICGAVWFENATATTRTLERQFTEKIAFTLAGKAIPVSTGVFKRYKTLAEAEAVGVARCSVTNRAWQPAYEKTPLRFEIGKTTAYQ
jgi:hypothetical protein